MTTTRAVQITVMPRTRIYFREAPIPRDIPKQTLGVGRSVARLPPLNSSVSGSMKILLDRVRIKANEIGHSSLFFCFTRTDEKIHLCAPKRAKNMPLATSATQYGQIAVTKRSRYLLFESVLFNLFPVTVI